MTTLNIIPRIGRRYMNVELFFPGEIFWSNTAIPYLRIACWCDAEGHNECCLNAMVRDFRLPSSHADELMVANAIRRYRSLYLSPDDCIVIRKRVSTQEINRAR